MLTYLHVKNLALIREAELEFGPGLNLISGETGAGKSILLGAILLCLGARSDPEMIRRDSESAFAELEFTADSEELLAKLAEKHLYPEEGVFRLSRRILEKKSVAKINGESVPLALLKEVAGLFIDVYGQHEQSTLLSEDQHLPVLDHFGEEKLNAPLSHYKKVYAEYKKCKETADRLGVDAAEREKRIDFLAFEIDEIEKGKIRAGEEAELKETLKKSLHAAELRDGLEKAEGLLSDRAGGSVQEAVRILKDLIPVDETLKDPYDVLNVAEGLLNDALNSLKGILAALPEDQGNIVLLEERISEIGRLKRKYGGSEETVLEALSAFKMELKDLRELEQNRDRILTELKEKQAALVQAADVLHEAREAAAAAFDEAMTMSLKDLEFNDVRFHASVEKSHRYTANGADSVTFYFSGNPGEAMKPLSRIASGGELSRLMLSVKTVSPGLENGERTWIFDEIDAGISGRTAKAVGEKLKTLAERNQVICISHLPQIVSAADVHFKIEKRVIDGETLTKASRLNDEESLHEIARLLGTGEMTEAVLKNAAELRNEMKKERA